MPDFNFVPPEQDINTDPKGHNAPVNVYLPGGGSPIGTTRIDSHNGEIGSTSLRFTDLNGVVLRPRRYGGLGVEYHAEDN
jgi:hypothetical protein